LMLKATRIASTNSQSLCLHRAWF